MKDILRYFLLCAVFVGAAALTAGCNRTLQTIVIKPDSKRFVYWHTGSGHNEWTCGVGPCVATMGTNCDPGLTKDDSTLVGYSHHYDPGTQPCPCWEYVDCAYRGYVGFDVSKLKQTGIVSATLKWEPTTQRSTGDAVSNSGNCIAKVYQATETWQKGRTTAGEEIPWLFTGETDLRAGELNVSQTVRGWLNSTQPNYGFFFVGPNENVDEKNNNECLTTMYNLRLEAIISVDQ